MRLNLELKTNDPDPAATLRACARLGAVDGGVLHQRDTYFDVRLGRLKLREDLAGGPAELIYYERPALDGVRVSRYLRVEVTTPDRLREALGMAVGILGVVEKHRHLFLFRHLRIHLDAVRELGSFVELEAVQPAGAAEAPGTDESLETVRRALGLDERESVAAGYLDLMLRARETAG